MMMIIRNIQFDNDEVTPSHQTMYYKLHPLVIVYVKVSNDNDGSMVVTTTDSANFGFGLNSSGIVAVLLSLLVLT